jgi:hypothetical protein
MLVKTIWHHPYDQHQDKTNQEDWRKRMRQHGRLPLFMYQQDHGATQPATRARHPEC